MPWFGLALIRSQLREMYHMEMYPMLCEKRHPKIAKGEAATLETIDRWSTMNISWVSFQIEPCKMGIEMEREIHCDWNKTKENEEDGSVHPKNSEWAGVGNTLKYYIKIY